MEGGRESTLGTCLEALSGATNKEWDIGNNIAVEKCREVVDAYVCKIKEILCKIKGPRKVLFAILCVCPEILCKIKGPR